MGQTDPTNVLSTGTAATRIPLRVLLVDDSPADVELVVEELRHGGYEPTWERVDTAAALTDALTRESWGVIICDWVMPQFSSPAALAPVSARAAVPATSRTGLVDHEWFGRGDRDVRPTKKICVVLSVPQSDAVARHRWL
jgi:CheY-like chemotaxis protein